MRKLAILPPADRCTMLIQLHPLPEQLTSCSERGAIALLSVPICPASVKISSHKRLLLINCCCLRALLRAVIREYPIIKSLQDKDNCREVIRICLMWFWVCHTEPRICKSVPFRKAAVRKGRYEAILSKRGTHTIK